MSDAAQEGPLDDSVVTGMLRKGPTKFVPSTTRHAALPLASDSAKP